MFKKGEWHTAIDGAVFQYRGIDIYHGDVTLKFYNPRTKRCWHPAKDEAEQRFNVN